MGSPGVLTTDHLWSQHKVREWKKQKKQKQNIEKQKQTKHKQNIEKRKKQKQKKQKQNIEKRKTGKLAKCCDATKNENENEKKQKMKMKKPNVLWNLRKTWIACFTAREHFHTKFYFIFCFNLKKRKKLFWTFKF